MRQAKGEERCVVRVVCVDPKKEFGKMATGQEQLPSLAKWPRGSSRSLARWPRGSSSWRNRATQEGGALRPQETVLQVHSQNMLTITF